MTTIFQHSLSTFLLLTPFSVVAALHKSTSIYAGLLTIFNKSFKNSLLFLCSCHPNTIKVVLPIPNSGHSIKRQQTMQLDGEDNEAHHLKQSGEHAPESKRAKQLVDLDTYAFNCILEQVGQPSTVECQLLKYNEA